MTREIGHCSAKEKRKIYFFGSQKEAQQEFFFLLQLKLDICFETWERSFLLKAAAMKPRNKKATPGANLMKDLLFKIPCILQANLACQIYAHYFASILMGIFFFFEKNCVMGLAFWKFIKLTCYFLAYKFQRMGSIAYSLNLFIIYEWLNSVDSILASGLSCPRLDSLHPLINFIGNLKLFLNDLG